MDTQKYSIPTWEHTYIRGGEEFPNKEIENFYYYFKEQFFKNNYLDLEGNTNYSFYLMYDILGTKIVKKSKTYGKIKVTICTGEREYIGDNETIKRYLPILSEKYPETKPYCERELGNRRICTKQYKGENYYLYGDVNKVYTVENDFPNKNIILEWLSYSDEFRSTGMIVYVNSNGIIDVISDNSQKLYGKEKRGCRVLPIKEQLPPYIKFGLVDGNFKYLNSGWNIKLSADSHYTEGPINEHDIISLQGCPDIVKGDFIGSKIGLTNLKYSPHTVYGDFIVSHNKLVTLDGLPSIIHGNLNLSNNCSLKEDLSNINTEVFGNINIKNTQIIK